MVQNSGVLILTLKGPDAISSIHKQKMIDEPTVYAIKSVLISLAI
jgi:hypothetical protein